MRLTLGFAGLFVVTLLLLLAPAGALRGEEEGRAFWAFTIRVVRVDLADPAMAERDPWDRAPGRVDLEQPWPEVLATLASRGRTTLLLDQSLTGPSGLMVEAREQHDSQLVSFQNRDLENQRWVASQLSRGVQVRLRVSQDQLEYDAEVLDLLPPYDEESGQATVRRIRWQGAQPARRGEAIALRHAAQYDLPPGDRVGVELHAFLTLTPLSR
jgi:hypothetical protein